MVQTIPILLGKHTPISKNFRPNNDKENALFLSGMSKIFVSLKPIKDTWKQKPEN